MHIPKALLFATAIASLVACDDVTSGVERAKQGAVQLGKEALHASADALDTRSVCLLAGQSASLCGCIEDRIGSDITPEHIDAFTEMVRATVNGGSMQTAAESARNIDAQSREAIVQCSMRAAVEGVVTESEN